VQSGVLSICNVDVAPMVDPEDVRLGDYGAVLGYTVANAASQLNTSGPRALPAHTLKSPPEIISKTWSVDDSRQLRHP
jgi:hypothetical protein